MRRAVRRIERPHLRTNRTAQLLGVSHRADRDVHLRDDTRLEHVRNRRFIQPLPPHIGDDADDGFPRHVRRRVETVLEPLANGIVAWPEPSGHFLVDDHDRRRVRIEIAVLEEPAAQERDAHRLEVAGHHVVLGEGRCGIRWQSRRLTLECDAIVGLAMNEEVADRAGRDDARQRANPLHGFGVERRRLRAVVVAGR